MSDKMRWRYGDTNPVVAAVAAETLIEIGDMLWLDEHFAKPASLLADGKPYELQEEFAEKFLGVAMQRSRAGDTSPLRVATSGTFEFDCEPMTVELGNFVTPSSLILPNEYRLQNQKVELTASSWETIGVVDKRSTDKVPSVLVRIRSAVMNF